MMKKNEVKIRNAAIFHFLIWEDIQSECLIAQLENLVTVKGSKTEVSGPALVDLKRRIFIVLYLMWHGTLVLQFHLKDHAIYNDGRFLGDDLRTDVGVARMPLPLNGLGLSSLDQNLQPFAGNNEVSKWLKHSWNEQINKTSKQACSHKSDSFLVFTWGITFNNIFLH